MKNHKNQKTTLIIFLRAVFMVLVFLLMTANTSAEEIQNKRTWNSKTYTTENSGLIQTEFHGKWIHYLDDTGWKDINTDFYETNDSFEMSEAPFEMVAPKYSDGTAVFHNNNKWDLFENRAIDEAPLDMSITALFVKKVKGKIVKGDLLTPEGLMKNINYIVYEGAYPEGDLIYYVHFGVAPRLEKLIRLNSKPSVLEYKFRLEYSSFVEFEMLNGDRWDKKGILETDGNRLKSWVVGSQIRGIAFKQFKIWDSNLDFLNSTDVQQTRNIKPIQSYFIYEGGNVYTLIKQLPPDFFEDEPQYPVFTDTESTFYPDADPETTSVDGRVDYTDTVAAGWATVHDALAGNGNNSAASTRVQPRTDILAGSNYVIVRGFFLFDTSALPDTDTISSAVISFASTGAAKVNTDTTDIDIVSSSPASNTNLVNADYDQIGSTVFGSLALSAWTATDGTYNDITLNANGIANISKTGISKFATRNSRDTDNSAPTGNNSITTYMADQTGTATDPKLVVTYSAVPTITTTSASSIGDTSATVNGNMSSNGGSDPTTCGFAWGTVPSLSGGDTATTTDSTCPEGTGSFTKNITSLTKMTTYYFRAYATNVAGSSYGSITNFTTTSSIVHIRIKAGVRLRPMRLR